MLQWEWSGVLCTFHLYGKGAHKQTSHSAIFFPVCFAILTCLRMTEGLSSMLSQNDKVWQINSTNGPKLGTEESLNEMLFSTRTTYIFFFMNSSFYCIIIRE